MPQLPPSPTPADESLQPLFTPLSAGALEAPHRVWMAPLTRNRAQGDGTPKAMAETYYAQRASAGLIISEATQISPLGKGYIDTPGIHSEAQVAAWKRITEAVHAEGGRLYVQLWHVGRISHVSLLPPGEQPVSASALRAEAQTFGPEGFVDTSEPRALATDEIPQLIEDYRHAARQALAAGFDGVEVHSANGYLLDQFLHAHSNQRTDGYGGNAEGRARLTIEITKAVADIVGAGRTGLRLSPTGTFNDMRSAAENPDDEAAFVAVLDALKGEGLSFLHVVEQFPGADVSEADVALLDRLHKQWPGPYVANGDFDGARAAAWIARGRADAVTFGRPFISNPDLPERLLKGADLTPADQATFYGGGEEGYTDYPALSS